MLGVPFANKRWALLATGALLGVYVLFMSRDLSYFDSGELALALVTLGVGHPTGQPFYTLLGYLVSHVPGLSPLFALNLLSATAGAAAALFAMSALDQLVGDAQPSAAPGWHIRARYVGLAAVGLHPALMEPSTRIELYALTNALAVYAFARAVHERSTDKKPFSFLFAGFAVATHPIMGLAIIGCVAFIHWRSGLRGARALAHCAAAFALGVSTYMYLIVRGQIRGGFVWGDLRNSSDFLAFLSAADYRHNQRTTFGDVLLQGWDFLMLGTSPTRWLSVVVFAISLAGLLAASNRPSRVARASLSLVATASIVMLLVGGYFVAANTVFRVDNPDYNGYVGPGLWLLAVAVALVIEAWSTNPWWKLMPLVAIALMWFPPRFLDYRADDHLVRTLNQNFFDRCSPNTLALVESDHLAAGLLYLQAVEHVRSDVVVVPLGLASSSWYWDYVFEQHPTLHAIPLRGPGGLNGRLARLHHANPTLPILAESPIPPELGESHFVFEGYSNAVLRNSAADMSAAVQRWGQLAETLTTYDQWSLFSLLSERRAQALCLRGDDMSCSAVLHAGFPTSWVPTSVTWAAGHGPRRFSIPPLVFGGHPILGDPRRNLFLFGLGLLRSGEPHGADFVMLAAERGLPEANAVVADATPSP